MIAVTGATGHLGRLVIAELLKKVEPAGIVAVVRDLERARDLTERGVQVRKASYDEPSTLESALAGVDELLFISGSEVGKREVQHRAVIAAAKQAGVKLLVYTSILRAETAKMALASEHVATEQALRASGLPVVLLRNGWYLENYTENLGPALEHGAILGAAKNGRVAAAARADYAAAAAVVLTEPGHAGKTYELAGDSSFSLADLAAEVSRQANKPVAYNDLPTADYAAFLVRVGVPAPVAEILANADEGVARGELDAAGDALRRLIGRPTTSLAVAVAAALAARA